jgi:hypothetical protein
MGCGGFGHAAFIESGRRISLISAPPVFGWIRQEDFLTQMNTDKTG